MNSKILEHSTIRIYNLGSAIRGMRNPLNSWDKDDHNSQFDIDYIKYDEKEKTFVTLDPNMNNFRRFSVWVPIDEWIVGENNLKLMKKLVKAGSDHAKFLRQILVCFDLEGTMDFWKQFDTYKVATVANSCSTMHKVTSKTIDIKDFDISDFDDNDLTQLNLIMMYINGIINNKDLSDVEKTRKISKMMPQGYKQKRTITLNYEVLRRMYFARKGHKLLEWQEFCKDLEEFPLFKELFLEK